MRSDENSYFRSWCRQQEKYSNVDTHSHTYNCDKQKSISECKACQFLDYTRAEDHVSKKNRNLGIHWMQVHLDLDSWNKTSGYMSVTFLYMYMYQWVYVCYLLFFLVILIFFFTFDTQKSSQISHLLIRITHFSVYNLISLALTFPLA